MFSVIKLFCYQNAHWQHIVYQNVMVSTCYHNIVKHTHMQPCTTSRCMHTCMNTCTVHIRRTHAVVQATHTKNYQVIHQLIGTDSVQILRETAQAEQAEPRNYIIRPTPPIVTYPGPQTTPPIPGLSRNKYKIQPAGRNLSHAGP